MQETYSNDYSLLRPFDLEAAKRGEPLTTPNHRFEGRPVLKYTAGPDSNGDIVVTNIEGGNFDIAAPSCFAMAPLAWVEGKPVYNGDVLWYKQDGVADIKESRTVKGISMYDDQGLEWEEQPDGFYNWSYIANMTWTKPKQKIKKQIWINVYPEETFTSHQSKERAEYMADKRIRIDCVPVEIEYEVE